MSKSDIDDVKAAAKKFDEGVKLIFAALRLAESKQVVPSPETFSRLDDLRKDIRYLLRDAGREASTCEPWGDWWTLPCGYDVVNKRRVVLKDAAPIDWDGMKARMKARVKDGRKRFRRLRDGLSRVDDENGDFVPKVEDIAILQVLAEKGVDLTQRRIVTELARAKREVPFDRSEKHIRKRLRILRDAKCVGPPRGNKVRGNVLTSNGRNLLERYKGKKPLTYR